MAKRVLITGGAGFIGSHVADVLLEHGYEVTALDNLSPQVHGEAAGRPSYLNDEVELIVGDVRDREAVANAIRGTDAIFHFAAAVGVGQSMYQIAHYTDINDLGTAVLLQELLDNPVEHLVVASSMSIYGEGLYKSISGKSIQPLARTRSALENQQWDPFGADGESLIPVPTPESKRPDLTSVYALNKYVQEQMCLISGRAAGICTTALRFFNVYGPRQALSNPYTGVLAIFGSRYLNRKAPLIFEDGLQRRDFVHVRDIANACRLVLEAGRLVDGQSLNIGSGRSVTIQEIAERLRVALNCEEIEPNISGQSRVGDIRHCFADVSLAKRLLNYRPRVTLEAGIEELAEWLAGETAEDSFELAAKELASRGLTV